MPKFKFLPDIATADLAFEAFGKTSSELFINSALALEESMVKLDTVEPKKTHTINKEEDSLENLLILFLEELVFLKDAEQLVFSKFDCKVVQLENGNWKLETKAHGEAIDPKKHELGVDVKAVTRHLFKIEELSDKSLRTQVILDV